jgi:hypothetical protein
VVKAKTLPGPDRNEVKIWFQGATGSGKTLLARLIAEALEAKGLTVRGYVFGGKDWVPKENQWVDLTHQDVSDVLTVEMDSEGVMTCLGMGEDWRRWKAEKDQEDGEGVER